MSQLIVATRPQEIVRSRWHHSGRLLLSLCLSLAMLGALLFVFSRRTLALASETTLTQRAQNSALVTGSTITGTYGELLTVTLRFTVTADTVLTGPVRLTTRFPGVAATLNNQLGFRFLGYQDPITISGVTPLTLTGFVSATSGTAPNITTVITWTFDEIANTSGITSVYEAAYQVRFAWDGVADSTAVATINGSQTSLVWGPGGTSKTAPNNLTINLRKPDLTYSSKTVRVIPGVQGGATVVYTVTLKNGNTAAGFSTAYDLVVTDSLDSRMAYGSANPVPDVVNGNLLTWNTLNWSLAPNATWTAYVTATLPVSVAANLRYTNTFLSACTTQPGDVPDEATLTATASAGISGGIIGTKQVFPTTNVRIGDSVTYTVRMTVSQDVYLATPIFTDTLPPGFHYQSGTFTLNGGAALSGAPITVAAGASELLIWRLNDIPADGTSHIFTVNYIAGVTGINADDSLAYSSPGTTQINASNSVIATWQDSGGSRLSLAAPLVATTQIAQPVLNNAGFGIGISSWKSTPVYEVGSTPVYTFSLANTGPITAYEVSLSFQLPPGVSYQGNLAPPTGIQFLAQPAVGATGALQFIIQELPKNSGTIVVPFDTRIENTAMPGNVLSATLSLIDYSSQPDGMGVYDRHYSAISAAIPFARRWGFTLKGLTAIKSAAPNPVQPGQVLTYSILYSNTSAVYTSTNVQIIDTYDPLLTYVSSTSLPDVGSPASDTGAHTLTWDEDTLNPNSSASARITATFQVAVGISSSVRMLTNTITSDSDSPAPAMSRIVTTTLVQPKPTITLDDKNITVTAGSLMTYTMIYTNAAGATGATTGTFDITLDYAPYLAFITSTGRLPVPLSNGTLFTDTLGPGISRTVLLRLQVARPLPYTLTSFTSTATIAQPSINVSDSESENTPVNIPVFTIVKVNTSPLGNPPVIAGDGINYQIYVTNTGTITANNVVITDVWDANTYSQNGTGWSIQGMYGVYTIATVAPGGNVVLPQLSMYVNTLPSNAQIIRNTAQLSSHDTTQQGITYDTPIAGLFIQKMHTPDPVYPGQVLTYTIVYTAYNDAIVSPIVTDTLPPEVTYVSCAGAESCNASGGQVVWSWPNGLVEGNSGDLTLVVVAPATEWITLTNTYASNATGGATYREGAPDLTYVGRPHLSISKRATTAVTPIAPGDLIVYTLTYTNSGSYKSTGTQAFDAIPANTTFQTCEGAPCGELNGLVTWSIGEVPITTTGTLTMVVRVNPDAGTTTIVNNAYSLTADREVTNEGTPPGASTSVVRPALAVYKSVSPGWIALGGTVTYTVQYTNTGGGTFTAINFTDPLDTRTAFVSASPNCAHSGDLVGGTVNCADSNLAPGQSRQFTLTVQEDALSNGDVVTNAVDYVGANQTEALPVATSNIVEVPASSVGAAADFVGAPLSGPFPLAVTFTNLSSGSGITSYLWDFGDGATSASSATTVPHTYSQPGVYTVTLKITTDSGRTNTRTRSNYITIPFTTYTLTVATAGNGAGIVTPTTGAYTHGTVVLVTATPSPGSIFTGWSGDLSGSANPTSITMTEPKSITATFSLITHTLTVTIVGNGLVTPTAGSYISGTVVPITATASPGSIFTGWSGDLNDSTNPTLIAMDEDKSITATFSLITHTLTIATAGNGSGSVLPAVGSHTYMLNEVVPITATASPGSIFTGWSGDLSGSANPTSIMMDGNKSITATFSLITHTLTVATAGNGSGSVSPAVGTHTYTPNEVVPITATASPGSIFTGWSGALSGSATPTSITMDGNKSITATFSLITHTLTVTIVGNGLVTPTAGSYISGTVVPITATASAGSTFTGWSGDLSGRANPTSITMDGNKSITATFSLITHTLTVTIVGNGLVTPTAGSYISGTVVPITATASPGSIFTGWSGDLSGSTNPTSITMDRDKSITATFSLYKVFLPVVVRR